MNTLENNNKNAILSKILFSVTLFMILLRKYSISILRTDFDIDRYMTMLFYGSIAMLFLQFILLKKHNITELAIFLTACVLYVFTREGSILVLILLAISVKNIDDEYVIKNYLLLNVVFIIACILIGNLIPQIAQIPETHYRFINNQYIPRETFGFANPNSIFLFSLTVYAAYIYMRFDKYNLIDRIILVGTTFYIYNKTMSRTGFITIIVALIFVEILKIIDFKNKPKIAKCIKILPILFLVGSIIIGTVFSNMTIFNKILASRPKHWYAYLIQEGSIFTLFGNKFSEATRLAHPLDSSYIYMLSMLGIVSLVFFMYLLYKGLDIFIENNEKKYIAIVMMFLIYALAENTLLEAGYNFTIVLLIKYVIDNNPLKKNLRREDKC